MNRPDRESPPRRRALSRRRFLSLAASAAGTSLLRTAHGAGRGPKLAVPFGRPPSRVVQVRSAHVLDGAVVHRDVLAEMLQVALAGVTQTQTAADAWRSLLKPDDVIGLKFNRSGQDRLGTTGTVAEVLIRSIMAAGIPPGQIVCIEAPPGTQARFGIRPSRHGYEAASTDFGSGQDQLAAVLGQVSVLINVPYLKTHKLATLTCALKNLSHGLIKHPARYHRNGCSPYIADIVAVEEIRAKLRLCLVDALRVVYDEGSSVGGISGEGILLASVDPVAVDTVGLGILNDTRQRHGLGPVARSAEEIDYLSVAHRRGLGLAVPHGINVVHLKP